MKKLTLTALTLATALTAGLAFAATPDTYANGEVDGCDNHSGACGETCKAGVAEAVTGASNTSFETEASGCDVHSGACGSASVSAASFEAGRNDEVVAPTARRSYAEIQAEINRLLADIDFEG